MRFFTVKFFSAFVLIMTISSLNASITLGADVETREFDVTTELKSLNVDNAAGKVEIKSSETDKIKIRAEKSGFGHGCELNIDASKKEVSAISKSFGAFNTNQCLVHFQISIPQGMAIKVRAGSGHVAISGRNGGLKVRTGSGDVMLDGEFNFVDALTGSGDLKLKTSSPEMTLKTGSGDLVLEAQKVPAKMNLEIESGSGDATILLPPTAKIWTRLRTGSGDTTNELGDTSDAMVRIEVQTGSGDIHIKKL